MRLAAQRFLDDLVRAKKPGAPFRFDEWHAEDACRFLELLPHVEGKWDTPHIVLHPSHIFATVNIFGFRRPDGTRRFTSALWAVARKNAKSTWAGGVMLYCELVEDEVGPQVVSAATTGAQARIVFNIAKRMVAATPAMQERFNCEAFANAIACYDNGGTFKPINAKASTQDGLNPSAVCCDELHAHKSHDLLNVLTSAAGARRNPLFLFTTTEGYENPGPWAEERDFAQNLLEGALGSDADHYFCVLYGLDDEDDEFDESKWVKANPLIEINEILASSIRKEAVEAKGKPGKLAEFKIKRLNRPASTARGWIDLTRWNRCDGAVPIEQLVGAPCWGGLDLASTLDTVALSLYFRWKDKGYAWWRFWVPEDQIAQREARGRVPYAAWRENGLLTVIPGAVVDYKLIAAEVIEAKKRFNVLTLAFDPWNAPATVQQITDQVELQMVEFRQGFKSYHPAMKELERIYTGGELVHGGHKVARWHAANIVARKDENENLAPSKKRSADKIDGISSLLMAIGASLANPSIEPKVTVL